MTMFRLLVGMCMCVLMTEAAEWPESSHTRWQAIMGPHTWVMWLDRDDQVLTAACYDPVQNKSVALEGTYDEETGQLGLKEIIIDPNGEYRTAPWFSGRWTKGSITGAMAAKVEEGPRSVTWNEVYPQGCEPVVRKQVAAENVRMADTKKTGIQVKCRYLQLAREGPAALLINNQLRVMAFHAGVPDQKKRAQIIPTAADIEARLWERCAEKQAASPWREGYLDRCDYHQSVMWNERQLLCVRESTETYAGGAHGYHFYRFHVFSLISGERLTLNDVLLPGYQGPLLAWARADLLRQAGCELGRPLTEAGLEKDQLALNQNWWIDARGLGFNYAPYEIACYARGMVEFQFTWKQMQPWLKPDAALSPLLEGAENR